MQNGVRETGVSLAFTVRALDSGPIIASQKVGVDEDIKSTMMMGAEYYQTESQIASLLAEGKVPIGVGQNTKIRNCIIDKNAKIGKDVVIANKDFARGFHYLGDYRFCC